MSIALEPSGAWATAAVYRYTDSNRQYDSEQLMVKRAVLEPLDRPLQPLRMRDRGRPGHPQMLSRVGYEHAANISKVFPWMGRILHTLNQQRQW